MPLKSLNWLFRKRTILGGVLVAGIVAGTYLQDFWKDLFKGWGNGGTVGVQVGRPDASEGGPETDSAAETKTISDNAVPEVQDKAPDVVRIVIEERSYLLRLESGDIPLTLEDAAGLAKRATGDQDGIRVRIYRKGSSRPSAENALQDALTRVGVGEAAVLWVPNMID